MANNLFCTFTHRSALDLTIDYLACNFEIKNNLFNIYYEKHRSQNKLIVFNSYTKDFIAKNTIPIHIKKYTNTIYTINALNTLIRKINNNILDHDFSIDWELYTNKLLTSNSTELFITEILFEKKIKIN